jgi:hypothetical protein
MAVHERLRILVVIPSRLALGPGGNYFLEHAIRSVATQKPPREIAIDIAVGVDPGTQVPSRLTRPAFVHFVMAPVASQAAALNSAAALFDHDVIAFLEDDDLWSEQFLEVALPALDQAPFVSSTQLEVDAAGDVICINDFPTPSGWIMRRQVWQAVGPFDESYRFHLDNEWLGRLAESNIPRLHLVESTAPLHPQLLGTLRPRLQRAVWLSGGKTTLARHKYALPLVRRLVHQGSGMAQIGANAESGAVSDAENARLVERFGRVPW